MRIFVIYNVTFIHEVGFGDGQGRRGHVRQGEGCSTGSAIKGSDGEGPSRAEMQSTT